MSMDKSSAGKSPDEIISQLGGCGRFQVRMALLVHLMKTVTCWNLMSMIFITTTPNSWFCKTEGESGLTENTVNVTMEKSCSGGNDTKCTRFEFESDIKTIVTEVRLTLKAPTTTASDDSL